MYCRWTNTKPRRDYWRTKPSLGNWRARVYCFGNNKYDRPKETKVSLSIKSIIEPNWVSETEQIGEQSPVRLIKESNTEENPVWET